MKSRLLWLVGLFVVVFCLPTVARAEGRVFVVQIDQNDAPETIIIVMASPDSEPIIMGTPDGDPIVMGSPDSTPIAMGTPDTDPIIMGTPDTDPIAMKPGK